MEEGRQCSSSEIIRMVRQLPDNATFRLTAAAITETEIRDELKTITLDSSFSDEEWTAWALKALSPYVTPVDMAEAHMPAVRHNVKVILRLLEGRK